MTVKNWNPQAVRDLITNTLTAGLDMAGKFVEDEARARLRKITQPDTKRDVNYRRYLADYILKHVTEVDGKDLVTRIGMRIGDDGQTHHGFYIETGSSTAPAQPFLRPALFHNARDVISILENV